MHHDPERCRSDKLLLQTICQDEHVSQHSGSHKHFLTWPLAAEASVGVTITFLVFINSVAPNIAMAMWRQWDEFMPTTNVVLDDLNSKTGNASGKATEPGERDVEMVDIDSLSAPEALAIYFADEDMALRDGTLMNSPADEQRRDARKFAMDEALRAIQETSWRSSCIMPNEVPMSNSGRATVARVANGRIHELEKAGCMARTSRMASVKPFNGAPAMVYRTIKGK